MTSFGTGKTGIESRAFILWEPAEEPKGEKTYLKKLPLKTYGNGLKPSPSAITIQNSQELRESAEFKHEMDKIKARYRSAQTSRVMKESPLC